MNEHDINIESIILSSLFDREEYARHVIPFLREDYFSDEADRIIFSEVNQYIGQYNTIPSKTAIDIAIKSRSDLNESKYKKIHTRLYTLDVKDEMDFLWLKDTTEKFCQDKAIYNAIFRSIEIIDAEKKQKSLTITRSAIPDILKDALSVSFDVRVGHDWTLDYSSRFDAYTSKEERIPFGLSEFNTITNGGTPKKTLNIVMATTNAGKTLFMCDYAAFCLRQGLNVLYITCEMAEERIAQRIDANMLSTDINELEKLSKEVYTHRIESLVSKTNGKLIIKEYPTATANVNHFRVLLKELKLKKNFTPEIIFVDYLNICQSARIKSDGAMNPYVYIKAIAEELRGLAVEYNLPVWSATQSNRSGHNNTDVDLTNTAESWGLPATADFFLVMMRTQEFDEKNWILWKQLKNRYNDASLNRRFITQVDRAKMKLYDLDSNEAEEALVASRILNTYSPDMASERESVVTDKPAVEYGKPKIGYSIFKKPGVSFAGNALFDMSKNDGETS